MNRSQSLLITVSWLTIASAGYVAGQAPTRDRRPLPPRGVRVEETQTPAKTGDCAPAPLPNYRSPQGGGGGKADGIDGAVTPRPIVGSTAQLAGAHDAALRTIRSLTSADATWVDRYLAAETRHPIGNTIQGRLYLRLDAIEQILGTRKP